MPSAPAERIVPARSAPKSPNSGAYGDWLPPGSSPISRASGGPNRVPSHAPSRKPASESTPTKKPRAKPTSAKTSANATMTKSMGVMRSGDVNDSRVRRS